MRGSVPSARIALSRVPVSVLNQEGKAVRTNFADVLGDEVSMNDLSSASIAEGVAVVPSALKVAAHHDA